MLVLQVLDVREEGLKGGELLTGPTNTQEIDIVTGLAVILITLLKLYREREKEKREKGRERETEG